MAARNLCWLGVAMVVLAQVRTGMGYSSGAPQKSCGDMTPRHGASATSPSPFRVTVTPDTFRPGDVLEVKVSAPDGRRFKGFLLQARPANNLQTNETLGTFGTDSSNYIQPCGPGSLTHSSPQETDVKIFKWTAPSTPQNVIIRATIVESRVVFYLNVDSKILVAAQPTTTPALPVTTLPTTSAAPVHTATSGSNATTTRLAPTSVVAPSSSAPATPAAPPTVTTTTRATSSTTTTPPVSKNSAAAAVSVPGAAASILTTSTAATIIATTATTIALTTALHSSAHPPPANSSTASATTFSTQTTTDATGLVPLTEGKRTLSDLLRQLQANRRPQPGGNNQTSVEQLLRAINNARRRVRQRGSSTTVRPHP